MSNRFDKPPPGFLDLAIEGGKKAKTFLDDVDQVIDWRPIERLLKKKLRRNRDAAGNPAFSERGHFCKVKIQR